MTIPVLSSVLSIGTNQREATDAEVQQAIEAVEEPQEAERAA